MLSFPSVATTLQSAAVPFEERFNRALDDMRRGRPVILMDDFDRENEADLIAAAETI
jgi:3,4-dihydroxy 2-butanone 4-phosphate synthase